MLTDGDNMSTMIATEPASESQNDETHKPVCNQRRERAMQIRTLIRGLTEIANIAHRLNMPQSLVDTAQSIYNRFGISTPRTGQAAIGAACFYIACRKANFSWTLREICAVSAAESKDIGRQIQRIIQFLRENCIPIEDSDFMRRWCYKLYLPVTVIKAAMHITNKAKEMDLVHGRSPISVAAAAIYMASQASNSKRSCKDIGDHVGVPKITIRQVYLCIRPKASELFPDNFEFITSVRDLPN